MAKNTIVQLIDDIDGGSADETVEFALDGTTYEVDLSTSNAASLRDALEKYVAVGRTVGSRGKGKKRSTSNSAASTAIRTWARANGYDIGDRGRISTEIREAYAAANS